MLHAVARGSGPVVVFLPGLGLDGGVFSSVVDRLETGFRCVEVDNLGTGASPVPPAPYTIAQMGRAVMEVVEERALQRPLLVGHSMGGFIAQWLALNYPSYFCGMVLLCSAPSFVDTALVRSKVAKEKGASLRSAVAERVRGFCAPGFDQRQPEAFAHFVAHRMRHPTSAAGFAGQLAAAQSFDITDQIRHIRLPALVLAGDADPLVDLRVSEALAALLPHGRLHVLPGVGHLPQLECPEAVAVAVADFFRTEVS